MFGNVSSGSDRAQLERRKVWIAERTEECGGGPAEAGRSQREFLRRSTVFYLEGFRMR